MCLGKVPNFDLFMQKVHGLYNSTGNLCFEDLPPLKSTFSRAIFAISLPPLKLVFGVSKHKGVSVCLKVLQVVLKSLLKPGACQPAGV